MVHDFDGIFDPLPFFVLASFTIAVVYQKSKTKAYSNVDCPMSSYFGPFNPRHKVGEIRSNFRTDHFLSRKSTKKNWERKPTFYYAEHWVGYLSASEHTLCITHHIVSHYCNQQVDESWTRDYWLRVKTQDDKRPTGRTCSLLLLPWNESKCHMTLDNQH